MGKHDELIVAVRRADVTAVSKLLAKSSGSKSSMFCHEMIILSFFIAVGIIASPLVNSDNMFHLHIYLCNCCNR